MSQFQDHSTIRKHSIFRIRWEIATCFIAACFIYNSRCNPRLHQVRCANIDAIRKISTYLHCWRKRFSLFAKFFASSRVRSFHFIVRDLLEGNLPVSSEWTIIIAKQDRRHWMINYQLIDVNKLHNWEPRNIRCRCSDNKLAYTCSFLKSNVEVISIFSLQDKKRSWKIFLKILGFN